MIFEIYGVDDKIKTAIYPLINAFMMQRDIPDESVRQVFISSIEFDNRIKAVVKCGGLLIAETTEILKDLTHDKKNVILAAVYELLKKLTEVSLNYGILTGIRPTKLVRFYLNEGYAKEQVKGILKTKYKLASDKADFLLAVVDKQNQMVDFEKIKAGLSIYINIPFCLTRCSYCSFTSYSLKSDVKTYLEHLFTEIKETGTMIKTKGIRVDSVYIGGGTPSSLNIADLTLLLNEIEMHLVQPGIEYTFEGGRPDTLSTDKLKAIKNSSVTRISINPQTFNQKTLDLVKRNHSVEEFKAVYSLARAMGFDNINTDLIIGLPEETFADVKHSFEEAVRLGPDSVTVHALAYKRGAEMNRSETNSLGDVSAVFGYAYQVLESGGYAPYYLYRQKNITGNLENTGFAKPGKECLYNILMIEEAQNIIGLGCHASTKFLNHELILNPKDLKTYIDTSADYLNKKLTLLKEYYQDEEVGNE